MKTSLPSHYAEAMAFALADTTEPTREYYSPLLHIFVQQPPANRPELVGKFYLEAYEKVPGGVILANEWIRATKPAVREFFLPLANRHERYVSRRPYRLAQSCDGTICSPVFHAYKTACDALGLDADALLRKAYPGIEDNNWLETKRHAEWQGGVEWPAEWNTASIEALAESLTEINNHSLRTEFTAAAEATLRSRAPSQATGETPAISEERIRAILEDIEENHILQADITPREKEMLGDLYYEEDGLAYLTTLGEMELEEPVIRPMQVETSYKQHSLAGLSAAQVAAKIGFTANIQDDPNKVKFSWGFTVNGKACSVWDWKGSHLINEFSAFGPVEELRLVFGEALQTREEASRHE